MIDAIKTVIEGMDSLWVWGGSVGTLFYALFDHRDTREEIKEAAGTKKKLLRLKLALLWLLPAFGFLGAYSGKLSSEKLEAKIGPRTIPEKAAAEIASCLSIITNRGEVGILASVQDAEATNFAEEIEKILKKSGFEVRRPGWTGARNVAPDAVLFTGSVGAFLSVNDVHKAPKYAGLIQKCFIDHGILFEGMTDPNISTNDVIISVGQKP